MGRAASHVTLECALQTHPQLAVICEEVAAHRWGLKDVVRQASRGGAGGCRGGGGGGGQRRLVQHRAAAAAACQSRTGDVRGRAPPPMPPLMPNLPPCPSLLSTTQVADMVAQRAELGKNFGVVLVPEGLVEFMHDVSALIVGGWVQYHAQYHYTLPGLVVVAAAALQPGRCSSCVGAHPPALHRPPALAAMPPPAPHPAPHAPPRPLAVLLLAELNEIMAMGVNANDQLDVTAHLTAESADVSGGGGGGADLRLLPGLGPWGTCSQPGAQRQPGAVARSRQGEVLRSNPPLRHHSPCSLLQLFNNLPPGIRSELLEERDPHGNVQVRAGGRTCACGTLTAADPHAAQRSSSLRLRPCRHCKPHT